MAPIAEKVKHGARLVSEGRMQDFYLVIVVPKREDVQSTYDMLRDNRGLKHHAKSVVTCILSTLEDHGVERDETTCKGRQISCLRIVRVLDTTSSSFDREGSLFTPRKHFALHHMTVEVHLGARSRLLKLDGPVPPRVGRLRSIGRKPAPPLAGPAAEAAAGGGWGRTNSRRLLEDLVIAYQSRSVAGQAVPLRLQLA